MVQLLEMLVLYNQIEKGQKIVLGKRIERCSDERDRKANVRKLRIERGRRKFRTDTIQRQKKKKKKWRTC